MLSVGFTLLVEKSNYSRGAMIQAIYRSNFVLMGMRLLKYFRRGQARNDSRACNGNCAMYNILAVITLEIFRGNKSIS
jgi:hypothetical protein